MRLGSMKDADLTNENVCSQLEILVSAVAVTPYLEAVREAADKNTKALGFLASTVYEEFARQGRLYVATCTSEGEASYAGHLLFDPRFPRAQVLQMFCVKELRKQ